jgi:hypothetical protein
MTKGEIIEGNNLIAEFDGFTVKPIYDTTIGGSSNVNYTYHKDGKGYTDVFYDTSFNDLMLVIEKINNNGEYWFEINQLGASIGRRNDETCLVETLIPSIIEERLIYKVWLTVVKFIKWYNERCFS